MTSSFGEYILDSSVILAQVFGESRYKSRVLKIQKDMRLLKIDYRITPKVRSECSDTVRYIGDYLATTVRDLNRTIPYLKAQSNPSSNLFLEESDHSIFLEYFKKARDSPGRREINEGFETWIVSTLEDALLPGKRKSVKEFFSLCAKEATNLHSNLKSELTRLIRPTEDVNVGSNELDNVKSKLSFIKNEGDLTVLAEALEYKKAHRKVVFVSLDYEDLIPNAQKIEDTTGLCVTDPLYASFRLKTLR